MNNKHLIVLVIIVTYNPIISELMNLIDILEDCNCIPVIIDNSGNNKLTFLNNHQNIIYKSLESNKGIAFAQNEGLNIAFEMNADIVGFFDQDSKISVNLIHSLINASNTYKGSVIAPVAVDSKSKKEYPSQIINKYGMGKDVYAKNATCPQKVDIVISSGSFMSIEVINKVGYFDADLFIDFVDIDWCLRCRKESVPILIIPNAVLEHSIGDKDRIIWGMHITQHSPYRTYYKVRNSFLLLRKKYPIVFSLNQIITSVIQNLIILVVDKDKKFCFFYFKAIKDGILGRRGRL